MPLAKSQNPPTASRQLAHQPYETVREVSTGKSPLLLLFVSRQTKSEGETQKNTFFYRTKPSTD
jgi:hypothetical protein